MTQNNLSQNKEQIPFIAFVPFLLITFGLTWGIIGLYIFLPEQMTAIFGQISGNHPLFFLAVYAPAIAAFSIILSKAGLAGLRRYFTRLFLWRCSAFWYIFLLIGLPLIFYGGSAWNGNLFTNSFPFSSFQSLFIAFILAVIKGPVEEFGWRGFVQPLFQRRFKPIVTSLLIGIIWGFWHLPAFLMSGTQQSNWAFFPFFAGTIAISLIMTALFNDSKGSILLAAFMHFQLMNPIWPDAQPYDTYLLIIVAVPVVWFYRKMFFNGENAVVEIIP